MSRVKTGGRTKGTPNKRTDELAAAIQLAVMEAHNVADYDPIVQLALIAAAPNQDTKLAAYCAQQIAPYLHAKRKAVEHTGAMDSDISVRWANDLSDDELDALIKDKLESTGWLPPETMHGT